MTQAQTKWFAYGQREIDHLSNVDPALGQAIAQIGQVYRAVTPDLFTALVRAVIGQLISTRAAETIWSRLQSNLGEISPATLAAAGEEAIRQCGLTMKKTACIASIARSLAEGEWSLEQLRGLPDEEAIAALMQLKGIGRWTAEMVLLHGFERPDIVSWGDLGIRRGMMKLHGLTELTKPQFELYRPRYSPFGSVASFYLWEIS